jgi:hypothetical protein
VGVPPNRALEELLADSLLGRSQALRARFVVGPLASNFPAVDPTLGAKPGASQAAMPGGRGVFSFVSLVPFTRKFGDRVGSYLVGFWPGELRAASAEGYENPIGFIEVTKEDSLTRVSEHFLLGDFVTHDQQKDWPRYVVLREPLLDKLELVIQELEKTGILVHNVRVMSGFRTPFHNKYGLGSEGGARDSRHQFGDAADVIIDNDLDGRMDDLNRDRRVDLRDLDIVLAAVERVERRWPELVGGLGRYHATGPSGPFAHIDVRGYRARWSNELRPTIVAKASTGHSPELRKAGQALKISNCNAAPEFAVLCGGR